MCTLTYIPYTHGFLTGNSRDESLQRPTALAPAWHSLGGIPCWYPTDPAGGGSWILVTEKKRVMVLLNGATTPYVSSVRHTHSRGRILLSAGSSEHPVPQFMKMDLSAVAPFTMLMMEPGLMQLLRWDGRQKQHTPLDASHPHIFSSATLYSPEVRRKREEWFYRWLEQYSHPGPEELMTFHKQAGRTGLLSEAVRMRRCSPDMATVSITTVLISKEAPRMHYQPLKTEDYIPAVLSPGIPL